MLGYVAIAVTWVSVGVIAYVLGCIAPVAMPVEGRRGLKRQQAIADGQSLFARFEPAVRKIAAWLQVFSRRGPNADLQVRLMQGGEYLGLSPDEFVALSVVSALAAMLFGVAFVLVAGFPGITVVAATGLGAIIPTMNLSGAIGERFKQINRSLPNAIDLLALCMNAGMDFPGAIQQFVGSSPNKQEPICEEFAFLLRELELGHTRQKALEAFATRVPTDAVKDFVGAVVQAEHKGNPLSEVLHIQAGVSRSRRSVAAEEAAARAGVYMMAPMVLLLMCILLLMLGPMAVDLQMNGGL